MREPEKSVYKLLVGFIMLFAIPAIYLNFFQNFWYFFWGILILFPFQLLRLLPRGR